MPTDRERVVALLRHFGDPAVAADLLGTDLETVHGVLTNGGSLPAAGGGGVTSLEAYAAAEVTTSTHAPVDPASYGDPPGSEYLSLELYLPEARLYQVSFYAEAKGNAGDYAQIQPVALGMAFNGNSVAIQGTDEWPTDLGAAVEVGQKPNVVTVYGDWVTGPGALYLVCLAADSGGADPPSAPVHFRRRRIAALPL